MTAEHRLKFTHAIYTDGTPLCQPHLADFPEPDSFDAVDCKKCRGALVFRIAALQETIKAGD